MLSGVTFKLQQEYPIEQVFPTYTTVCCPGRWKDRQMDGQGVIPMCARDTKMC